MSHQPNLFSIEPGEPDPDRSAHPGAAPRRVPRSGATLWLERTELLIRVIVRLYLGLLIIVLPWMRFWTENGLFSYSRATAVLAGSGFVRGMVSGLGLLNVVMAFKDLFFPDRKP